MTGLQSCYNDSKNYSGKIMGDVVKLLEKEKMDYLSKSNNTEIIITSKGQSEDSVLELLNANLQIPKKIISLLLDVVEVSEKIYIRLKTK